jgi:hypothetical protein
VAGSGWRELRAETENGAALASGVEPAIVAEELGRGLADAAFLGPTLATELRRLAGAPASDSVETVAFDANLLTVVRADDGTVPTAVAIDRAGSSTALLLMPDARGCLLGQITLTPQSAGPDLTRPSAIPDPGSTVATVEAVRPITADDLRRWTALGLALTCADLVGTMRGAVRLACDYAAQRRQYGVAIGSFQAVQHMLADAHVATEGSRSVMLHAAWAVDALSPEEALAAGAVAKAYCARAARHVCETVIQVHGGIGNTWDCLAHVFLRRALLSCDVLGGTHVNLGRVLDHRGIGGRDGLR